jgi:CheY-like chemotaxis protein
MTEASAQKRLLVVDDEVGFCEFVRDGATGMNYLVETATNGARGQEIYAAFKPDVILLDVVMPDVDGIEFTRWLAAQGTKSKVVLVTGYNPHYAESATKLASALGLPDIRFATKPLRLATLAALLKD